jgi:hypothetical protein
VGHTTWSKNIKTIQKDFSHFPNPFPFVKNWRVISCGPNVAMIIEMWGAFLGSFVWSQLVPTPKQLIKHGIHGDYACGIELDAEDAEPASLIWSDGNFATVALEMAGPLQEAVIAVWAVSALFEGLDLAHSLYMAVETCGGLPDQAIMGDGDTFLPSDVMRGGPNLYTTLYDPMHLCDPTPGDIRYDPGPVTIEAFGYLSSTGHPITSFSVFFAGVPGDGARTSVTPPSGPGRTAWHIVYTFNATNGGAATVAGDIVQSGQGAFGTDFICTRFYLTQAQPAFDPTHPNYPHLPRSCSAPNQPPLVPASL